MTRSSRKVFTAGAVALALAGAALGAYFMTDGRAKEAQKIEKGPPAVPVTLATVSQETVPVRLHAIGNVEAYASVAVRARVDGQIVAVNFREGQAVRKGDVLFRIDPRPYEAALRQAEANMLRDAAARDQARSQERRYQELLDKNFISKEAYAQIRTNAATAEATAKASQAGFENAKLNLEYCTVAAPLDGYVGRALLQAGNLAKANDANPLVVINQVKPIYVNFAIPEQTLGEVRRLMAQGPITVEVPSPTVPAESIRGRLIFVDNAVDTTTGTIRLKGEFQNADSALWPGQFVNVSVTLYEQRDAIVVPAAALQNGPEGTYVYVVGEDQLAQVRKVTVERANGDRAIIAAGLKKGERVVTHGQLRLGPNTRVQTAKPAPGTS